MKLPVRIDWERHDRAYDIGDDRSRARSYSLLLTNGSLDDICGSVSFGMRVASWGSLNLPHHVLSAWKSAFPWIGGTMDVSDAYLDVKRRLDEFPDYGVLYERLKERLERIGFSIDGGEFVGKRAARIEVSKDGMPFGVDLGCQPRRFEAVHIDGIRVLDPIDVVGTKFASVVWRDEIRDFMDLRSIVSAERYDFDTAVMTARRCIHDLTDDQYREALGKIERIQIEDCCSYMTGQSDLDDLRLFVRNFAAECV